LVNNISYLFIIFFFKNLQFKWVAIVSSSV